MKRCKAFCTILAVVAALAVGHASATVIVDFNPWDAYIDDVGLTTTVDIIADIPETEAIVGWGLDMIVYDPAIADITGITINAALFDAVSTPDGDGLAGAVPQPGNVWGDDVVLATLEFTGYTAGDWTEIYSDHTLTDLTEGFAIDPDLGGGFADVGHGYGFVNVLPEPTTLALLAFGGLALLRRR